MRKRFLSIVSLVLVCLMLVACGGGTTPESKAPESQAPESQAPESNAPESDAPTTDWPTKPITVIVPAGAGGDTDINTRIFCKYMEAELGQTIVVSNIKGVSVALPELKNAPNDGYTMAAFHPGFFVASRLGTLDFNFEDVDVANIFAVDAQSGWFVSNDAPYQTLDELAEAAKQAPVSFATEVGSMSHLTEVNFMQLVEGSQFNIVDAGGSADKITALMGGQLDLMFNQVGLVSDYIENGDFKCLGVMSEERSEANPDIPTFKEQGYDMVFDKPYWMFFPAGTDQAIIDKFNAALETVCANEEYAAELLSTMQSVPGPYNAAEGIEYLRSVDAQYGELLDAFFASQK